MEHRSRLTAREWSFPAAAIFQGIQRLPGEPQTMVITSDSDTQAYFIPCAMAADGLSGSAGQPVEMAMKPLKHAGGCQAFGHFLVVGVEDNDSNLQSEVQFWDFVRFLPVKLTQMTIHRRGAEKVKTAGAVGLSSFGTGAALAVATFNAATIDFFTSASDPNVSVSPFIPLFTWIADKADKTDWIDPNWGAYQSVNLITQTGGELFLVGFHRTGDHADWMDLYSVNLAGKRESALRKVGKKHMICTDGCNFNAGAGIFIPSKDGFEVLAVSYYSGDHKTGTTIHVNHFPVKWAFAP
jgi:hypothetical protein